MHGDEQHPPVPAAMTMERQAQAPPLTNEWAGLWLGLGMIDATKESFIVMAGPGCVVPNDTYDAVSLYTCWVGIVMCGSSDCVLGAPLACPCVQRYRKSGANRWRVLESDDFDTADLTSCERTGCTNSTVNAFDSDDEGVILTSCCRLSGCRCKGKRVPSWCQGCLCPATCACKVVPIPRSCCPMARANVSDQAAGSGSGVVAVIDTAMTPAQAAASGRM
jgi:hypothetical protein